MSENVSEKVIVQDKNNLDFAISVCWLKVTLHNTEVDECKAKVAK